MSAGQCYTTSKATLSCDYSSGYDFSSADRKTLFMTFALFCAKKLSLENRRNFGTDKLKWEIQPVSQNL